MRALAVVLALLALAPAAARGYKTMTASGTGVELRWTSLPMKFNIHQAAAPGMTAAATQDAVRKAYQAWTSVSCSLFKSQDLGVVNLPWGDQQDRVNTHVWTTSWPPNYGQSALGITWTQYDPQAGKILDADTHYNPGYTWSNTGAASAIDAQSVATHEIGHQLGLDHTPIQDATMFYATGQGDTSQRSLHSDDIAGLCHLYPSGGAPPPECTSSAQCAPNESCVNQKCTPAGQKGYGGPCQSTKDCTTGICLDYSGNTFCSQQCDTQACPNGDKCYPVSGGGGISKACLPGSANMGSKTLGQTCTANPDCKSEICVSVPGKGYLCSQKCDLAKKDCPSGYDCLNSSIGGLCIPSSTTPPPPPPPPPPPKKALGEGCTSAADCQSDLCADTGSGKACTQLCELSKAGTCPSGFACVPVSGSSKGACVRQGPPPPPPKGALGAECAKNEECDSKLCASGSDGKQFCTQLCDPAVGCPGDFECIAAGDSQHACTPKSTTAPADGDGSSGGGCAFGSAARPEWLVAILVIPIAMLGASRRRRAVSGRSRAT
jgi:hypothetical protein